MVLQLLIAQSQAAQRGIEMNIGRVQKFYHILKIRIKIPQAKNPSQQSLKSHCFANIF